MSSKLIFQLPGKARQCIIEFVPGILQDRVLLKEVLGIYAKRVAIITEDALVPLYGNTLNMSLNEMGMESSLFSFPGGEKNKTRESKALLENALLDKGLGMDTVILALGGGVVTDMGGFIAGTFGRGIPLLLMPTTLLGMVDASLGGKNGVNTPYGKNLIGTLHQPKNILIDITTLHSLPRKELRNGAVEMIKHGLIADKNYFDYLSDFSEGIMALENSPITQAIIQSCQIKMGIVLEDENNSGKRHLLNFGHTMGHAIEKISDYEISHGEAIAIGILAECYISMLLGHLSAATFDEIVSALNKYKLPFKLPEKVTPEAIRHAMAFDKKSLKGQPRFTLLEEIGIPRSLDGQYCTTVDEGIVTKALHWMRYDLCSY